MKKQQPVHQLVHTLSYGDAISGEALALKRVLRDLGVESNIYSLNTHPKLKGESLPIGDFPKTFAGHVVLHYSLGSPLNAFYTELDSVQRILIYHNLTPPEWFSGVNPRVRRDIEVGVQELPELCAISDRLLADSSYNAAELAGHGFEAEVLPLPLDDNKWAEPRNEGIFSLVKGQPGMHVLHVGRLAPNKCIEDIIKVFYFLHYVLEKQSTLWLVGIDTDTEVYSYSLKRLVAELGLEDHVRFTGRLADSEVRALYEAADCYLCMSEHEGFCLPVIEAMYFSCPVVAYGAAALPDTVASGGVLVREKRHPEIARLLLALRDDAALRHRVVAGGKKRVQELSVEAFREQVKSVFHDVVDP